MLWFIFLEPIPLQPPLNTGEMKFFCIGRNYAAHAKELGNDVPDEPVIFMKPKSALHQPSHPFYYPAFTSELHFETELLLRISKNGKGVVEKDAIKYYDAISVGLDFTARDIQSELKKKGLPWEKAKSWDGSAIVGLWHPVEDGFSGKSIRFSLKKNGELVQQGISDDMIHSFNKIVSHISTYFSLNIGDVIFTGTPAGVGECMVGDALEGFLESVSVFKVKIQ